MPTFILLTRVSPTALDSPHTLERLEREVMERLRAQCPEVEWVANFSVLGPWDYVDVFRAPDVETATKVSALVRAFGSAHTEVWPATEWQRFKALIEELPE